MYFENMLDFFEVRYSHNDVLYSHTLHFKVATSSQNKQTLELHHCEAIPQPLTHTLNMKVCDTSMILFSTSMLTHALSSDEAIKEFRAAPNAVAGESALPPRPYLLNNFF